MKPTDILRFENLKKRGRALYIFSTAFSVAGVIAAIQLFNGALSIKVIVVCAFVGAVIAQMDWLRLKKRYTRHNSPDILPPPAQRDA